MSQNDDDFKNAKNKHRKRVFMKKLARGMSTYKTIRTDGDHSATMSGTLHHGMQSITLDHSERELLPNTDIISILKR